MNQHFCWVCGETLIPDNYSYRCPCCRENFPISLYIPKHCDSCGRKATDVNKFNFHKGDQLYTCALCDRIDRLVEAGQLDDSVAQSIIRDHHVQS